MFGTFQDEIAEDPIKYGLTKPLENAHNTLNHITHEWKSIVKDMKKDLPLAVRMKYLVMPPGWSHDGSSKTASQLRDELNRPSVVLPKKTVQSARAEIYPVA